MTRPPPLHRALTGVLALSLTWLAACSDDQGNKAPVDPFTTSAHDGAVFEPNRDPDAGKDDYDNEILSSDGVFLCGYQDDDVLEFEGHTDFTAKGLAASPFGMALAYQGPMSDIFLMGLPLEGEPAPASRVVTGSDGPQGPELASAGGDFMLLWRELSNGAHTLRARSLSNANTSAIVLGEDLMQMPTGASPTDVAAQDADFVVAMLPQTGPLRALRFGHDSDATPSSVEINGVADRDPTDIHLARLDGDRTLLAWLQQGDGGARVMGMNLNPDLTPETVAVELSGSAVDGSSFDLAGRSGSAGLLYHTLEGTRDALKFRRVENDGSTPGPLLNIVAAPGRGRDGAIAAFGQGYVIAYRALPSPGIPTPEIRIAFINQSGLIVHQAELSKTSEGGGQARIVATIDGHVAVAWSTISPSGAATGKSTRLYCPGALILCGGKVN